VQADDYLAYVHEIDHSPLQPESGDGAAIAKLPGRKLILTNGSVDHVDACWPARHQPSFRRVFGHRRRDLERQPAPQTYQKFSSSTTSIRRSSDVRDLARNLLVPHELGMTTVVVVPTAARRWCARPGSWRAATPPIVDHVTDDLTGFLQRLKP